MLLAEAEEELADSVSVAEELADSVFVAEELANSVSVAEEAEGDDSAGVASVSVFIECAGT